MKCHLCVNYIEMQTDPATCDYVIVCGAARKEERWDMADNEQILTTGEDQPCSGGPGAFVLGSIDLIIFIYIYIYI